MEHEGASIAAFMKMHHMKTPEEREYARQVYQACLKVPLVGDMLLLHKPKSAATVMSTAIVSTAQFEWSKKRADDAKKPNHVM